MYNVYTITQVHFISLFLNFLSFYDFRWEIFYNFIDVYYKNLVECQEIKRKKEFKYILNKLGWVYVFFFTFSTLILNVIKLFEETLIHIKLKTSTRCVYKKIYAIDWELVRSRIRFPLFT